MKTQRRKGLSEIVGALILIIIVVVAASSVALFIAQAEKNSEARQSYLTSVADEDLQFTNAQFSPGNPLIQWELVPQSASGAVGFYYVQTYTDTTVYLNSSVAAPTSAPAMTTPATLDPSGYTAANIVANTFVNVTTGPSANIMFYPVGTPCSTDCWEFEPATWSTLLVTVRNLNTADSGIYQIQVNGEWLEHWQEYSLNGAPLSPPVFGGVGEQLITAPAKGSIVIGFSFLSKVKNGSSYVSDFPNGPLSIPRTSAVSVEIMTEAGNFFTQEYSPPVALAASSTTEQPSQIFTRDIVNFDGSASYATGTSIQSYDWQIEVPTQAAGCDISSLSTPSDMDVAYITGETVQYLPDSIFTQSQLADDCISGPISATLVVTDNNGLQSISQQIILGVDPNISPIASMTAAITDSSPAMTCKTNLTNCERITVSIENIYGQPVSGIVVSGFIVEPQGSSMMIETVGTTSSGTVSFEVDWATGASGAVEFQSGSLPPVQVAFP